MNDLTKDSKLIGIILAGGAGRRMGGADKGLINLNGQPLIEHVLKRLESQVEEILIVANRHLDSYANYGHSVLSDSLPGFAGPLAGMLAGIRAAVQIHPQANCIFVPVDAPRLPADLSTKLIEAADDRGLAIARNPDGLQPVCSCISTTHLKTLEEDFDEGERSPATWFSKYGANIADFSADETAVWSLNTPEELQSVQQALHSGNAAA